MKRVLMVAVAVAALAGCKADETPRSDAAGTDAAAAFDAGVHDAGDSASDAGEPDAGPPEPCPTAGEMRVAGCGSCGMRSERCAEDGFWEAASDCLNEGACALGAVETETTSLCGVRSRICGSACVWGPWDFTTPDGECEAGTTRTSSVGCGPGFERTELCSDACEWEDVEGCVGTCGPLRTEPWYSEERCIPAGPFIRGDDDIALPRSPTREVTLSAFVIDRYPVTVRRFLECRAAGRCSGDLLHVDWEARLDDPDVLDHPVVGVSHLHATGFCFWDGERRLPTEHEWEKAARGPSPRRNRWPWEGLEYRCDFLPVHRCPGVDSRAIPDSDPVDAFPDAASIYGVEGQIGTIAHWLNDWWDDEYRSDTPADVDPQGPSTGLSRVRHGSHRGEGIDNALISRRGFGDPDRYINAGFRCARSID